MDCDCQGMNFAQARDAQIRNREANERASRAREAQQSLATALSTLDDAIGEQQLRVETLQERILTSAMHGTVVEIAKIPSGASSILSLAEPERIQSLKESVTELKLQNLALLFNWATSYEYPLSCTNGGSRTMLQVAGLGVTTTLHWAPVPRSRTT